MPSYPLEALNPLAERTRFSQVPDPALYPSGLDTLVSYVHSIGLGFGLYGDRGSMDCGKARARLHCRFVLPLSRSSTLYQNR